MQPHSTPDGSIPGFDQYSRHPGRGIDWFLLNIPRSVTLYILCAVGELYFVDKNSWLFARGDGLSLVFPLLLAYIAFVKIIFYSKLHKLKNTTQNLQMLRTLLRNLFRTRLYLHNISITVLTDLILKMRVMSCLISIVYKRFFADTTNPPYQFGWVCLLPVVSKCLLIFRSRFLTTSFSDRFQNLKRFEMNPFGMREFEFTETLREQLHEVECVICADEWQIGDKLLAFGCPNKHHFHLVCLSKWLTQQTKCPMCRHIADGEYQPPQ